MSLLQQKEAKEEKSDAITCRKPLIRTYGNKQKNNR